MKFNGFSFPHPVLGHEDDIAGTATAENPMLDETSDADNYILTITYKIENPDLLKLLSEKKATFVCELNCSSTLFRKAELSDSLEHKFLVPKNAVRDKVELLFLLISITPIPAYSNSAVHKDFLGYQFDIDTGDVLAFLGEASFIAGVAYAKLKAVSSFMEVIQGVNEEGDYNVILDSPKIQIQLSKKDYEQYCDPRIGKSTEYASVFHSSIVLPSLIHALYQLLQGTNKEDFKEKAWAKIIDSRIQNEDAFIGLQLQEDNILKLAQIFLGMPMQRLLTDLIGHQNSIMETES